MPSTHTVLSKHGGGSDEPLAPIRHCPARTLGTSAGLGGIAREPRDVEGRDQASCTRAHGLPVVCSPSRSSPARMVPPRPDGHPRELPFSRVTALRRATPAPRRASVIWHWSRRRVIEPDGLRLGRVAAARQEFRLASSLGSEEYARSLAVGGWAVRGRAALVAGRRHGRRAAPFDGPSGSAASAWGEGLRGPSGRAACAPLCLRGLGDGGCWSGGVGGGGTGAWVGCCGRGRGGAVCGTGSGAADRHDGG